MSSPVPVILARGDSWARTWIPLDEDRQPVSLAGANLRLHVRNSVDTKVLEASDSDGKIVIGSAAEGATMSFSRIDLAPGTYFYDLEITFSSGVRLTVDSNTLIVTKDYSHD